MPNGNAPVRDWTVYFINEEGYTRNQVVQATSKYGAKQRIRRQHGSVFITAVTRED